ncbi:NifB/NifX family molybdenum-iron cluster-binding protein [Anaerotignum faecicola]|nr:NifB/NifX family molybdenum-iron cluster-binding protein [Anaerotignum faecicola]
MIIAVTYENGEIFQHFGKTKEFMLYDVDANTVKSSKKIDTSDTGHGALAKRLKDNGVNLLICGGIGSGAMDALSENDIEVIFGASGDVETAVKKYLSGENIGDPNAKCNHHGEDHTCSH